MGPFLGVILHAIGGFASGSFYLPLKKIDAWSWESGWLINGIMAWLMAPIIVAWITVPNLYHTIASADGEVLFWTYLFGLLWGIGGLTFGLTMRFLGIGLGMAMALGLTAAFGTLIPPIYDGSFFELIKTTSGQVVFLGVLVSFVGIFICGKAGVNKDKQLSDEQKKEGVKEFNLKTGMVVAVISGTLSACFAFGIQSGRPLAEAASLAGTPDLWVNGPIFIIILLGGATTNFIYCISLNLRNKTYRDYASDQAPLTRNYLFSALAGITWYCQFMFYGMGTTKMGDHDFASWSIHMAFIIVFSTLWGFVTREWSGVNRSTILLIVSGLIILVLSTVIIGVGNNL